SRISSPNRPRLQEVVVIHLYRSRTSGASIIQAMIEHLTMVGRRGRYGVISQNITSAVMSIPYVAIVEPRVLDIYELISTPVVSRGARSIHQKRDPADSQ